MYKIHFVYEYYDGPIQGIADTDIGPCFFIVEFSDDQDDYTNIARLYPIFETKIDLAEFEGIPDYPLPKKLDMLIDEIVSDIENAKLTFKKASFYFERIKKGTSRDAILVNWTWA